MEGGSLDVDAVGVDVVLFEDLEPAPTLGVGTLVVCNRTLSTSSLEVKRKSVSIEYKK